MPLLKTVGRPAKPRLKKAKKFDPNLRRASIPWTEEEDDILRRHAEISNNALRGMLNRTDKVIRKRRVELGIIPSLHGRVWCQGLIKRLFDTVKKPEDIPAFAAKEKKTVREVEIHVKKFGVFVKRAGAVDPVEPLDPALQAAMMLLRREGPKRLSDFVMTTGVNPLNYVADPLDCTKDEFFVFEAGRIWLAADGEKELRMRGLIG